jgi:hypothetical protein
MTVVTATHAPRLRSATQALHHAMTVLRTLTLLPTMLPACPAALALPNPVEALHAPLAAKVASSTTSP